MTQEEKARAYDEALERAKEQIEECGDNEGRKKMIRNIFPELHESEDEKIRQKLLKCCDSPTFEIQTGIKNGVLKSWLEKQKEQKPAWSEDYREEDIQTRFAFYTYKDDPGVLYLSNVFVEETSRNHGFGTRILKAAEKAAEAIGAIKICLKVKQGSPANAWYRKHGYGYVAFEDGYDWLEKNLEYLKPTQPAEWSAEDEAILNSVIRIITRFDDLAHEPTFAGPKWTHPYTKELNFLEKLRNRLFEEND